MLSLSVRLPLGDLGISIPSKSEFSTSEKVTAPPCDTNHRTRALLHYEKLKEIRARIYDCQNQTFRLTDLEKDLSPSLQRALDLAKEKGASTKQYPLLTSQPQQEEKVDIE